MTFLGIILVIAFFLLILVLGFFALVVFISMISTIVKHKPKSYTQFKQARQIDRDTAIKITKNLKDYEEKLMSICSKPFIENADIQNLTDHLISNNLNEKQIQNYSHKAFKNHYAVVMEDNLLTEEELESLERLLKFLDIKDSLIKKELSEIAKHTALRAISVGKLPEISISTIALKRNEIAHFISSVNLREERVISKGYQGDSHGVSIRITKGVSYRVGQSRGKLVSEKGIIDVDSGDFVITNQRLIFVGNKKSFSYDYKKLLAWNVYNDGITLNFDNSPSRTLAFNDDIDSDILYFLLAYLVEQSR